jgi:undecaprenyl-diphosphatase
VVLAIVQGLTEFLPISSSGHLVLVPVFLGWEDQGLAFDVATHLGTLVRGAVLLPPRAVADDARRARHAARRPAHARVRPRLVGGDRHRADGRLRRAVRGQISTTWMRSPLVIAATMAGFGILLWVADARGGRDRGEDQIGWRDALIVGLAQAVALIPGTSRSGITITAALFLGLKRQAAARFSFLLSIPMIIAATCYELLKLLREPEPADWLALASARRWRAWWPT